METKEKSEEQSNYPTGEIPKDHFILGGIKLSSCVLNADQLATVALSLLKCPEVLDYLKGFTEKKRQNILTNGNATIYEDEEE